jgi:heptosyltransferase-1
MSGVLVVRPSSLGDVVYALALVSDIAAHRPGVPVDWVAEDAFVDLVRLDPRIRRVVPLGLRRWRHSPLTLTTWRDMADFRHALRRERYDVILNLQEQVKGAVVCWFARGTRHGLDRANIREPIATIVDHVHHAVSRDLHIVDRCRGVAAAALGYSADGPPRWSFAPSSTASAMPAGPYAVAFHATSRADKAWPEERWRALVTHFARAGFTTLLPWGNERERARSRALPADRGRGGAASTDVAGIGDAVAARRSRGRRGHRPRTSQPRWARHRGDIHGNGPALGRRGPVPVRTRATPAAMDMFRRWRTSWTSARSCCGRRRAASERATADGTPSLHAVVVAHPATGPAQALVARTARARLSPAHRRALRPL